MLHLHSYPQPQRLVEYRVSEKVTNCGVGNPCDVQMSEPSGTEEKTNTDRINYTVLLLYWVCHQLQTYFKRKILA
jgi:hypothetical protein